MWNLRTQTKLHGSVDEGPVVEESQPLQEHHKGIREGKLPHNLKIQVRLSSRTRKSGQKARVGKRIVPGVRNITMYRHLMLVSSTCQWIVLALKEMIPMLMGMGLRVVKMDH